MIQLRDYQEDAIQSVYDYYGTGHDGNPLLVLPTGAGKSLIQAEFVRRTVQAWPDQRIIVATHVKELIEQNAGKLEALWPRAPMGIVNAGMGRRQYTAQIIYGSVQSMYRRPRVIGHTDLLLIDEAHLVPRASDTMYGTFIDALRAINPAMKVIGLTATPYRTDSGLLHEGDGALFTDIAYDLPITTLIDRGYLVPVRAKSTTEKADLSGVRTRAGEFRADDAERAMTADGLTLRAVDEIIRRADDRRSWLIFAVNLHHAEMVLDALRMRGVRSEMVSGETPKRERERVIAEYREGRIRALVNVGVLTTGFDAPATDLLALLRPTKSPGLHVQMIGRGMRTSPETGKTDCLVLDFAGNCARHGPIAEIHIAATTKASGPSKGSSSTELGEPPSKECPSCGEIVAARAVICDACRKPFPVKHADRPDEDVDVVSAPSTKWLEVTGVQWRPYQARSGRWHVRIDYQCGLTRVSEYLRRDDEETARASAEKITEEHQKGSARWPEEIHVRRSGKYWNVIGKRGLVPPHQHPAFSSGNRGGEAA